MWLPLNIFLYLSQIQEMLNCTLYDIEGVLYIGTFVNW